MHKKTLEDLAYYRIRDAIAGHCASSEGARTLSRREPQTDITIIEDSKTLSREWTTLLHSAKSAGLKSWPEVLQYIKSAKPEGATLEQDQLYAIYLFTVSAISCYESILTASKELPIKHLNALSETLPVNDLRQCSAQINAVIDSTGMLKDLPVLREIRSKIASIQAEIDRALKKYTSDSAMNTVLESNVPAFRQDRQVLAVKASQRLRINGIVHEVSASGQTLYIEPDEVVRKNNELIQEEFHLQQETRRIFTNLTSQVRPFSDSLREALKIMVKLDCTYAAARWGIDNKCIYALGCEDGSAPMLLQARHPLLLEKAVPIDICFLQGKNILIITGPNTGGKTVTIKTFALFAMLNQTGFPIPAAEGTRLPVFNAIFADIGDEQSIDQSLSTFSAHMKNIAAAVKHADEKSLVLLDELGSGTDPTEGSAIAMAVLDHLIDKHAFVLVTTHHGILKNYGYTNEYCVNASVDFDSNTLSPTYRLLMGVPGESHALDIAKRSGLPHYTVDKAKSYLTNQQADVSSLIKGLTQKHAELAVLQKEANIKKRELLEQSRKAELKDLKLRQKENEIKERENRDASIFLTETRRKLENLVRTLREGEITREKTLAVKSFITELSDEIAQQELDRESEELKIAEDQQKLDEAIRADNGMLITKDNGKHSSNKIKGKKRLSAKEAFALAKNTYTQEQLQKFAPEQKAEQPLVFANGAEVFAGPSRTRGILIKEERRGLWSVQLGSIRMNIKEKDMVLVPKEALSKSSPSFTVEMSNILDGENSIFTKNGPTARPVFELKLLGLRTEEAIKLLQRQLDLCSMQNFRSFSVIHGKGNGILQQAVKDYLSNYPGVKEFHYAPSEDGGAGKTYVTLV